jgi:hypothetical protein
MGPQERWTTQEENVASWSGVKLLGNPSAAC